MSEDSAPHSQPRGKVNSGVKQRPGAELDFMLELQLSLI